MPKLVVFRGDAVESEVPLGGENLRIGRDAQNDLVLDDPTSGVSRFHAEIRAEAGTYTIVDLNSRNGIWVNRRRVENAVLVLGTPVTLGAYQLVLEDQSGSQVIDEPLTFGATVVTPKRAAPQNLNQSATGPVKNPASRASRQRLLMWSGAAIAVLGIIAVTWAFRPRPAAPPVIVETPPPQPTDPPPPPDPRIAIEKHLADAREQINQKEFEAAIRDHLDPVLQLDSQNSEAADLKVKAEAEIAKGRVPQPPRPPKPIEVVAVSVPGIPRLANETNQQYEGRTKRVQDNYAQGALELERKQFAAAIRSFEAVERDQGSYRDVRALIETAGQRSATLREAMENGAKYESAGQLKAAIQSYRRAEQYDPTTAAAEKAKALRDRLVKEATVRFDQAQKKEFIRATLPEAMKLYEEIVDALPEGEAIRDKAQEALQRLRATK